MTTTIEPASSRPQRPWERYAALALQGWSSRRIAAECGVTAEWVLRSLRQVGLDITELRNVRCSFCGTLMRQARDQPRYDVHHCQRVACRTQYNTALRRACGVQPQVRLSAETMSHILALRGHTSERTVARMFLVSRSEVNAIWRGHRGRAPTAAQEERPSA